jgi:hypothetical protein
MRDELVPTIFDYKYDSHSSPSSPDAYGPGEWNYDSQPESIGDRHIEAVAKIGRAISFAFPLPMEYDLPDETGCAR